MIKNKSVFNNLIRIRKKQKEWLRKNKEKNNCKTMAGFLDKIINNFKNEN